MAGSLHSSGRRRYKQSRGWTFPFPATSELLAEKHRLRQMGCNLSLICYSLRWFLANILIVDDDIAVQAVIRLLLERDGHDVQVASDGLKGLKTFETGDFDLLIVDIFMPGMDGLETMRLVHQQRPDIPIIVISGRPIPQNSSAGPDFLAIAIKLGAINTLQKPFKAPVLRATVTKCLEAAKSRLDFSGKTARDNTLGS
jgi:CheY-like chemotaxis protein